MSVEKKYYVIAGYDLTGWDTDRFKDWKWTEEGEIYICNHIKGEIQLFDDPMCGEHFYFGYILASGDEYEFETAKFNIADIERQIPYVKNKLFQLQEMGVVLKDPHFEPDMKIIVFEECT